MDWITNPDAWIALVVLTVLEIVLGIDNIVFISIQAGKLPVEKQKKARFVGLFLALIMRVALLGCLSWITQLTAPLFTVVANAISWRDLILIAGGLFLLAKATIEIHKKIEGGHDEHEARSKASFRGVIIQIVLLDLVFSIDSVITAVGMAERIEIMVAAVVIAVAFMMVFAGAVSGFVDRHPTVKMLALSFLLLIGVALIADGLDLHIPKGYIYFAMGFSVMVEMLNQWQKKSARAR
jgi:predicted tellurium resistance membrane protein TerC